MSEFCQRLLRMMLRLRLHGRGPVADTLLRLVATLSVTASGDRCNREADARLVGMLSSLLSEPCSSCRRLLRENAALMTLYEARRKLSLLPEMASHFEEAFHWPNETDYVRFCKRDRRSRIVAAYHYGDYLNAYARLGRHAPKDRRRLILRQVQSANEHRLTGSAAALHGQQTNAATTVFLDSRKSRAIEILAQLRRGDATVVIFCDLPPSGEDTVTVDFLGHRARFSRAIADLSLAARCPVLPVICRQSPAGALIHVGRLLQTEPVRSESGESAVARITQHLATVLESELRKSPGQWRYLRHLPAYYIDTETETEDQPTSNKKAQRTRSVEWIST